MGWWCWCCFLWCGFVGGVGFVLVVWVVGFLVVVLVGVVGGWFRGCVLCGLFVEVVVWGGGGWGLVGFWVIVFFYVGVR